MAETASALDEKFSGEVLQKLLGALMFAKNNPNTLEEVYPEILNTIEHITFLISHREVKIIEILMAALPESIESIPDYQVRVNKIITQLNELIDQANDNNNNLEDIIER